MAGIQERRSVWVKGRVCHAIDGYPYFSLEKIYSSKENFLADSKPWDRVFEVFLDEPPSRDMGIL